MTLGQKNRSSSLSLQSVLMDKQQKKPPVSGTRKAKRDWLRFKTQKAGYDKGLIQALKICNL